jgi:hypothetical protein
VDDWSRLDRFLILGAEGRTYYITERELVKHNHDAILRCINRFAAGKFPGSPRDDKESADYGSSRTR